MAIMRSVLSFRVFMLMYGNEQLYALVVRACALGEKNTAKIQSFCSVSTSLSLLCRIYSCEHLRDCSV